MFNSAVHESIISIPTPRELREYPCHPEIERVMHEEIRENRAAYALNAKDNFQFERKIFGWRRHYCVLDLRRKR
jgi:hypothetical protein